MRLPFLRAKPATDEPVARARRDGGVAADDSLVQLARTRARRRLVGALILLSAGVLGFPILFETQPRPLPVDTPILIPAGVSAGPAVRAPSAPTARPLPALPPDAGTESVAVAASAVAPAATPPPGPAPAALPAALAVKASAPVPASKPVAAPAAAKPDAKPAVARPASASATEPATAARFVVQVGAYNDAERMRAARQKLEKLGYKTYTQEIDTPTGQRTRVRVGPFVGRSEAEAVAAKVKASGMQANILAL